MVIFKRKIKIPRPLKVTLSQQEIDGKPLLLRDGIEQLPQSGERLILVGIYSALYYESFEVKHTEEIEVEVTGVTYSHAEGKDSCQIKFKPIPKQLTEEE